MRVFLDTNAWIDFLLERRPGYDWTASILSAAVEDRCEVFISSLTAVNVHYICHDRAKMPLKMLRRKIDALKDWVHICDVVSEDIYSSYSNEWEDFEDGVQYYAAVRAGVDYIVTGNAKDFSLSKIPTCSASEFIKMFQEQTT